MYLWDNYVLDNELDEVASIVKTLLGKPPIYYIVFDKWWILSRPMHETSSEIEHRLSLKTLENFAIPETRLEKAWFEKLLSGKTNN